MQHGAAQRQTLAPASGQAARHRAGASVQPGGAQDLLDAFFFVALGIS